MNRRADVARFVAKVRAVTARVLDAQAGTSAGRVRESISTPYPPASSPGSSPHLRTGNLHDGVSHSTRAGEHDVTATLTSARADGNPLVPFWLENGTEHMAARPYMGPERNVAGPRAKAAHADKLRAIRP